MLKPIHGVCYTESVLEGGSVNLRLGGESFYTLPNRNMRKAELEQRQIKERQSKVEDYRTSREGNFTASLLQDNDSSKLSAANNRY